jgi:hypothetical protein
MCLSVSVGVKPDVEKVTVALATQTTSEALQPAASKNRTYII